MNTTQRWLLRAFAVLLCVVVVSFRDWKEGYFDWGNWVAAVPFLLAVIIFNRTRKRI
jgi:hypothetical protein